MPLVILTGVEVKPVPPQVVLVIAVICGVGSTVTVTVNVAPVQLPDSGVTVYVAVATALVLLVSNWLMFACAFVCSLPPSIEFSGLRTGVAHVYVVPEGTIPFGPLAGEDVKLLIPHIVVVIAVMAGVGLTVTVNVKVAPVQLPDNGVTVYVAVCVILVGLPSVPLMLAAPLPAAPPVSPPVTDGAAQL